MSGSTGYLRLIHWILMTILLDQAFGSETVPGQTITNEEESCLRSMINEDENVQRRIQDAEEIWSEGVRKNREQAGQNRIDPKGTVIWDYFYPDYNCPHNPERLGRVGNGGKWICGVPQLIRKGKDCVVYSYGIANDTSFEKDILDRTNCSVHMYDHTIKIENVRLPKDYPGRATISKLGIGHKNTGKLRTLKSEMDARGHSFIDVLKMDVEGAEFKSLEQMIEDFPNGLPFGQLSTEIHLFAIKEDTFNTLKGWWGKLERAGLRAFHNEPNWIIVSKTSTHMRPICYEYSFLNVKVDHAVLHA